jgi:hypothetical protein
MRYDVTAGPDGVEFRPIPDSDDFVDRIVALRDAWLRDDLEDDDFAHEVNAVVREHQGED